MAEAATPAIKALFDTKKSPTAREQVTGEASQEFVFAVVGHIGCGTST